MAFCCMCGAFQVELTMDCPKEQTLVQFLGRIKRLPPTQHHDLLLGPGPTCKGVIEITGCPGSSPHRRAICLDLIADYLLPVSFGEFHVGGLGRGVMLLDADHIIDIFKLVRFMEARVTGRLPDAGVEMVQEIITGALRRLAVIQVFSHAELVSALRAAENYILHHRELCLVVLDSISSFYWSQVATGGIRHFNRYTDDVLKTVDKFLGSFDICFIYTRAGDFFSKTGPPSELSTACGLKNVHTRIDVNWNGRLLIHKASEVRVVFFELSSGGVKYRQG